MHFNRVARAYCGAMAQQCAIRVRHVAETQRKIAVRAGRLNVCVQAVQVALRVPYGLATRLVDLVAEFSKSEARWPH